MSGSPERWVLCGGATAPDAPDDALRLTTADGPDKNLTVDISGIGEALIANVPPVLEDLVMIASYVLAADQAVSRGDAHDADLGERWRRRFRMVIGVQCPDVWSTTEMRSAIEETLGRLSDDTWTIEFQRTDSTAPHQLCFSTPEGEPFLSWEHVDDIALFSGGLDSLSGAAQLVLGKGSNVVLVSHRSANKMWKVQRDLVADLRAKHAGWGPAHVGVRVVKHDQSLRQERTQRTRSFLFAAMAGAVARLVGINRVSFYENGVVSLNLPVSPQVVGAKATRTTHPLVLSGFSRILSLATGRTIEVANPYELKTRTEILKELDACGGAAMIVNSVSCAHVHVSSTMTPHCGTCSQCIDRQFAVLAAGVQEHDSGEGYAVSLTEGEWNDEAARTMLLDYIATADRFASCGSADDFFSTFGEATRAVYGMLGGLSSDAKEVARAVHDLHRRHGRAVGDVLSKLAADNAMDVRNGRLAPNRLVMLLNAEGLRRAQGPEVDAATEHDPVLVTNGEYVFKQFGENWTIRFRGGKAFSVQPYKGLTYINLLLRRPGEVITAFALIDMGEGREVASRPLATALGADQETIDSVKAAYEKLKNDRTEAEEFCDHEEVARIDDDMAKLAAYLNAETGPGHKIRRENPEQKKARNAVSENIKRAIDKLREHSPPLASHLTDQIQRGFFCKYRQTGIPWET